MMRIEVYVDTQNLWHAQDGVSFKAYPPGTRINDAYHKLIVSLEQVEYDELEDLYTVNPDW